MDYFGLWIDPSLESGSCRAQPTSSTFNSPLLSSTQDFQIETVEVWVTKEKETDERLLDKTARLSVLDTGIGETSLLEMAGRTMYSKDVKEQKIDFDYV
jgi:hypothetical protein